MSDRLTQLQICLDQLVEQFNATVHYVNIHAKPALLDEDPTSVSNRAATAPAPQSQQQQQQQQQQRSPQSAQQSPKEDANQESKELSKPAEAAEEDFDSTLDELATDIVLKSRQINMLIDSLPGIGVTPEAQMKLISDLSQELKQVEHERQAKIEEKDTLLRKVDDLIKDLATGISQVRS
ncbi:SRB7 [Candida theae]|uniref:Mediator of RNA polymerase II transcription subunit 21 n=1 Tax=Candida theae TaxID=1198502 RepID=A0AAD5BJJ8_9ASCO|nr:SRB7 [Candida theae]KAI5967217.1 SRB7 [Candida theae]